MGVAMSYLPQILLLLFVLNLGTAFGAGLYEAKVVIPQWFRKSALSGCYIDREAMRELDSGRKFWAFVTTLPLTLLTLASFIVIWLGSPGYNWWLAAALLTFCERISTFTFFIPTIIKFQRMDTLFTERVSHLVTLWVRLNYIRTILMLVAWLFALRALVLC